MPPYWASTVSRSLLGRGGCENISVLKILAEVQDKARYTLFCKVAESDLAPRFSRAELLAMTDEEQREAKQRYYYESVVPPIRAAFRASLKKNSKFYYEEVCNALDWVISERPAFDNNQRRADWSWFLKRSQEWHEEQNRIRDERWRDRLAARQEEQKIQRGKLEKTVWDSLVEESEIDGLQVVPLTSGIDLLYEGREMHNCVDRDYFMSDCSSNSIRLFSIRKEGKRLATLQIVRQKPQTGYSLDWNISQEKTDNQFGGQCGWQVGQCYGPCNQTVDETVLNVAEKSPDCTLKEAKTKKLLQRALKTLQDPMRGRYSPLLCLPTE